MSRTEARDQALGALYAAEQRGDAVPDVKGLSARARRLVLGIWEMQDDLDEAIAAVARGWRVERMPAIDRNILRIGLFELRTTETPVGVIVSEAVNLAKTYSTESSGSFVNGVLAALITSERPAEVRRA